VASIQRSNVDQSDTGSRADVPNEGRREEEEDDELRPCYALAVTPFAADDASVALVVSVDDRGKLSVWDLERALQVWRPLRT